MGKLVPSLETGGKGALGQGDGARACCRKLPAGKEDEQHKRGPYKWRKPSSCARSMPCRGRTLGMQHPGVPGPWGAGRERTPDVQGMQFTSVPIQVAPGSKLMPRCRGEPLHRHFAWLPSHRGRFPAFTSSLCCI